MKSRGRAPQSEGRERPPKAREGKGHPKEGREGKYGKGSESKGRKDEKGTVSIYMKFYMFSFHSYLEQM